MARRTPLIGLTTYHTDVAWSAWNRLAAVLPAPYFELVAAAGGRPLLVPPTRTGARPGAGAAEVVDALDGLVIVGGSDVDPARYGAEPHPDTDDPDAARDGSEMALLAAALEADLPVLAICRGLQVLNVALGGTLHQHLPSVTGDASHQPARGRFADMTVTTVAGTRLGEVLGPTVSVQCSHHQAIDRLGSGLVVSARAAAAGGSFRGVGAHAGGPGPHGDQGVVEGAELPGHRFVLGVQWHPEESGDLRLFEALVAA